MTQIVPPYPQFVDSNGSPLEGTVYVGSYSYNPKTNPIAVYWDEDFTLPAAQPLQVTAGLIVRQGTPARVWADVDDYSIAVYDTAGALVYYEASGTITNTLRADLAASSGASLIGFIQAGTGATATTVQDQLRSDYVLVKNFGATPAASAATNTTAIINAMAAAAGKRLIFEPGTYQVNQLVATASNVRIIGNSAILKYTANISDSSLKLTNCYIENLTLDGDNFAIGDSTNDVKDSAPVTAAGDFFKAINVVVKNLHGLEDNYQYGIVVKGSTISHAESCKFDNIRTRTDSTNTGGFCGGYAIYQPQGDPMTPATHMVSGCVFNDIYTTQNGVGDLYPDSDGVRSYYYDFGTGDAAYDTAVKETVVTVKNCSFINVLKSACKLQDSNVYIEGCRVTVNDLKSEGQVDAYTGFRYQRGHYVKVSDCSVVGLLQSGALLQGDNSYLENFYFGASAIVLPQSMAWIGNTATNTSFCAVNNASCSGTDYSLDIYGCNHVVATNCDLVGSIAVIHCARLQVSNSKLDNMLQNAHYSAYAPYLNRAEFSNCEIVYFGNDGFYANDILSSTDFDLVINACEITYCRAQLVNTVQPFRLMVSDTYIDVTSAFGAAPAQRRLFDITAAATFYLRNVRVRDNRTTTSSQILIYASATNENIVIDGFVLEANTGSNYNNAIYLAPSADNICLQNLTFTNLPTNCTAISVATSTNPSITNIRCNYTDANLNFVNNGKAVVNNFHGTLKAGPGHITSSGTTVSEYNTTTF